MASAALWNIRHRLFLAVLPPAAVRARIGALQRELGLARPLAEDRLHATLLCSPLYDALPEGLADETAEAAASVRMPPFRVIFDRAQATGSHAELQPSEPLAALGMFRERIGFIMRGAGIEFGIDRRFRPHITLSYNCPARFTQQLNDDPLSWRVEEFVLIHSHVGLTKHVELGRWRLG
jgi:RNA 2',3'-cyclic 3'-phosphodiesterase